MRFHRSRTQILYRYVPGAIFEHDTYGICRVTDVAMTAPDSINADGIKRALTDYLIYWNGFGDDAFPDPYTEWHEYKVGVPDRVSFEAFPTVVECSNCGHVNDLAELSQLPWETKLVCTKCHKGKYRQLAYASIHNCGKLTSIPTPGCPAHGHQHMVFIDKARFVTSIWQCKICGWNDRMPRYICRCSYSRKVLETGGDEIRCNMQYVRTNDTSVLYSHVLPIVNLSEEAQGKLKNDPRPTYLLLARQWGLIDRPIFEVVNERAAATAASEKNHRSAQLVSELLKADPNNQKLRELAEIHDNVGRLPEDGKLDRVEKDVPGLAAVAPSQALLEHIAILDSLEVIDPNEARASIASRSDRVGLHDFNQGVDFARETLGLERLWCITDFPIALVAVGYSRGSKVPGEALLSPFRPSHSDGGKVPLYAVTSNTEAIMFQLDPHRLARWLIMNGFIETQSPLSGIESWIWCRKYLRQLADFRGIVNAPDSLSLPEKATLCVLHTISHLLMKHIEWSGFDPESVGEYILPETLSVVIHSNNYSSFTIGGMVTLFEQRLNGWLQDSYNAAFNCVYNPICEDEGASCSGCLHRQYNCEGFNSYLSRAVLQGGYASDLSRNVIHGYWMLPHENSQ